MTLDDIAVRDLPTKSNINLSDYIIVEDDDGTKVSQVNKLITTVQTGTVFNTVEDMKNSSFNEGDVVTTLGYYAKNDGGGARYLMTYAPTDLNNGADTIYLYTSDTIRAKLIHNKEANVLVYGAKGDGSQDDYKAFNYAIESGYKLIVPPRTYYITNTLNLNGDTIYDFQGSTLICPVKTAVSISSKSNITIKNLYIEAYTGLSVSGSKNIILDNVNVKNSSIASVDAAYGICISGDTQNVTITNSRLGDNSRICTSALELAAGGTSTGVSWPSNILVTNSILNGKVAGIEVSSASSSTSVGCDIVVDNCVITNPTTVTTATGILVSRADVITVKHSTFKYSSVAIKVAGTEAARIVVDNIRVVRNSTNPQKVFSIESNKANLYINGLVDLSGLAAFNVFENMNGSVYISGEFYFPSAGDSYIDYWSSEKITGNVYDYRNPLAIPRTTQLVKEGTGTITLTDIRTCAIQITSNSTANITINSISNSNKVKNQLLYLYGSVTNNTNVIQAYDLNLGTSIISVALNPDIPVIFKNINNVWTRIG